MNRKAWLTQAEIDRVKDRPILAVPVVRHDWKRILLIAGVFLTIAVVIAWMSKL